jgi:hypothetical protein
MRTTKGLHVGSLVMVEAGTCLAIRGHKGGYVSPRTATMLVVEGFGPTDHVVLRVPGEIPLDRQRKNRGHRLLHALPHQIRQVTPVEALASVGEGADWASDVTYYGG